MFTFGIHNVHGEQGASSRPDTRRHALASNKDPEAIVFVRNLLESDGSDVRIRVDSSQPTTRLITFQRLFVDHKIDVALDFAAEAPFLLVVTLYWDLPQERVCPLDTRNSSLAADLVRFALLHEMTVIDTTPQQRTIVSPCLNIQTVIDVRNAVVHPSPLPGLKALQSQMAAAAPAIKPFD